MAYFLKKSHLKNGLYLQIYFSFRDPEIKETRHRCIRSLGYVHNLQTPDIPDPIEYYQLEVNRMNADFKAEKTSSKDKKISSLSPLRSLGYFPLKSVLDSLKISAFVDLFQLGSRQEFSLSKAFEALVYARAVNPCSKRKTCSDIIPSLWEDYSISYSQSLDALSLLGANYEKIVEILTNRTAEVYSLDTSSVFFDCTNFYFEIDAEDLLRRKGPSKENRTDPILGMGLLLDRRCIPIGMRLYPGNQSEKPVLRSAVKDMKKHLSLQGKTVQVADKGLNCAQNIYEAKKGKDGYLFSRSVKTLPQIEKEWVLKDGDDEWKWVYDEEGKKKYRYKSCIDMFSYSFVMSGTGKRKKFSTKEKRVATFSPKLAKKKKMEIAKMVSKASRLCTSRAKKSEYGESAKYMRFVSIGKDGAESGNEVAAEINEEAIAKDMELAGYNMLVTSETEMEEKEIYKVYHQLWRIEESFRILKSELDARPVYLQDGNRIKGHFLVCYAAVLLERIFQILILKDRFSAHAISELIRNFNVIQTNRLQYVNTGTRTPLIEEMCKYYSLPLNNYFLTKGQIKKVLGYRFTPLP